MDNNIKKHFKKNFVAVPNSFVRDKELSLKSKGLFAYMFSMEEDWNFTIKSIASLLPEGRDSISSSIKELKDRGFLSYEKHPDGSGTYHLYVEPKPDNTDLGDPNTENPDQDNPTVGKPDCIKKTIYTKKKIDKLKEIYKEKFPNQIYLVDKYSEFYIDQLLTSFEDDPESNYHLVIEILYGANPEQRPFDNVLKMAEQFDYNDFINIMAWKKEKNKTFKFSDYLCRMDNYTELRKKNRRVKNTLVNWINMDEKR